VDGLIPSPITGTDVNVEFLSALGRKAELRFLPA
jgi:hypothetical protein